LDRYLGQTHRWDRRDRFIRLRSRTWFLDRPADIPMRLARRWQESFARHAALPLEEYVTTLALLNDGQVRALQRLTRELGFPWHLQSVEHARYALRLYASLSPAQRQSIENGSALSVSAMTAAQQGLFASTLRGLARHRRLSASSAQIAAGRLALTSERGFRMKEPHEWIPNTLTASPAEAHHRMRAPSEAGHPTLRPRAPAAATDTQPRYPVLIVSFLLLYGDEQVERIPITVTPP
jgi:hypothetical protein